MLADREEWLELDPREIADACQAVEEYDLDELYEESYNDDDDGWILFCEELRR